MCKNFFWNLSEDIPIKSTKLDSNVDEIVDTGSEKRIDPELDLKTAEEQEKDDTKYVGVTDEVAESTKDVNETENSITEATLIPCGSF